MPPKPEILIFDVNETLLDMSPLKEKVNKKLRNEMAFQVWFPSLLQYSLVESLTGGYNDFSKIALATLKMTAREFGMEIPDKELENMLSLVKCLPAHPEVPEALTLLSDHGYRMIALTNGKSEVALSQLEFAGLASFFEEIISIEEVKRYKPHPDTYNYVIKKYGIEAAKTMMVAAHGWDITGALRSEMQAAFIKRPGKSEYPLAGKADLSVATCLELAEILIQKYSE